MSSNRKNEGYTIKSANHQDLAELNRLYKLQHPEEAAGVSLPIKSIDDVTVRSYPLIVEMEGRSVGYALLLAIKYWDFSYGSLEEIYVEDSYRRKGIASLLIDESIEIAQRENLKVVLVETSEKNNQARKLYEKKGFEESGKGHFKMKM